MTESKCLPQVGWRAHNLSFSFNLAYNLSCGWLVRFSEHRGGSSMSFLTLAWYHLFSHWAADCHTVPRLWLMKPVVALYLRRPFYSGDHWSQGLPTHKDMFNQEGNPYLRTGHPPSSLPPHITLQPLWPLRQRPWLSLRGLELWFCEGSPPDLVSGCFLKKKWRYKTQYNPLFLNILPLSKIRAWAPHMDVEMCSKSADVYFRDFLEAGLWSPMWCEAIHESKTLDLNAGVPTSSPSRWKKCIHTVKAWLMWKVKCTYDMNGDAVIVWWCSA